MTLFLDLADIRELVVSMGVPTFISELARYIEADFRRWEEFSKAPRVANYVPNGVIELMPTCDRTLYSFKYVNGHPNNTNLSLPTVMAFSVLAEVKTGAPILLAEFTLCTALRTAATSALAASVLGPRNSRTMALIGCGAQSEFQTLSFQSIVGIEVVRIYDIDPAAMDKYETNLAPVEGLKIVRTGSVSEAVSGADVITLATADKNHATILTPEMVRPGVHINAVGGDSPGKTEIHPDVIREASVFVEFEPQSRVEGDVQQMTPDFPVTELWKVLANHRQGRETETEVTIFDSVGFAIEDFATLRFVYDLAKERKVGKEIDLIANPANPKDLYQLLL